jgi:hypothetical protein
LTLEGKIFVKDTHWWMFKVAVVAYYRLLSDVPKF